MGDINFNKDFDYMGNFNKDEINDDSLFHSVGLYSKDEINYAKFHQFSRFGRLLDPYGRLNTGREYLFFVKPDLHICVPKKPDARVYDWGANIISTNKQDTDWTAKWKATIDNIANTANDAYDTIANVTEKAKKAIGDKVTAVEGILKKMVSSDNSKKDDKNNKTTTGSNSNDSTEKQNLPEISGTIKRNYSYYKEVKPSQDNALIINPQLDFDGYFQWLVKYKKNVVKQLQYSIGPDGAGQNYNPFCYILSSTVNNNLSLSSSTSKTMDNPSNVFGTNYNYLQDSEASDEGYTFSLEFIDNKYLDTYHFFKAYSHYHNLRKFGTITPPHGDYYKYRRLHNTMGIYKFIVSEDAETLIYWAYLWGVFPTNCPRDAFQDATFSDGLTFSVDFEAAFIEDMDPRILLQFNRLMKYVMGKPDSTIPKPTWNNWEELPVVKQNYNANLRGYDNTITSDVKAENKFKSSQIDGRLPSAAQIQFEVPDFTKSEEDRLHEARYRLKWYVPKHSTNNPKFNIISDPINPSKKDVNKPTTKPDKKSTSDSSKKSDEKDKETTTTDENQNQNTQNQEQSQPESPEPTDNPGEESEPSST